MTEELKLQTSCETCVFAQFDTGIQIGCDTGRLDKFCKIGKCKLNDANSFYIIDGICNMSRGEEWANHHLGHNLIAIVEDEIKIKLDFVILAVHEGVHKILTKLPDAIEKCINQFKIKPQKIVCVVKNGELDYNLLYNTINSLLSITEIKFELIRVLEPEACIYRCFDMGIKKCKSNYTACFDMNELIPHNLIYRLNQKINYDMEKVSMVEPYSDLNGLVLQTVLYRLFGRNHDNIKDAAIEQKRENQILKWEDLWTVQK